MEPPRVQSPFAHSRCCRELGRHELPPERTLLLRLSSYGLMRQSRRLSSPSAIASCEESTQVATSPCCQRNLLDVILRIFPWLPGPLPRRSHRVHAPVDFPDVIGLPPRKDGLASRFIPRTRLFVGEFSRLQTFRYVQAPKFVCLPDRSHRYGNAKGRPRLLHPGRTCFVASARTGYASRPLRPEGRGNDCLKKGANCQTCCPISTTLEGRAARQRTVLEPFDNESHSRKAGAEVARHRCICQHQRGEGPRWIAR
jgi:hypothetical protein